MRVLRYILSDYGITLIVDQIPAPEAIQDIQRGFDQWAQMKPDHHFPVIVLVGDENTQIDDLRSDR